MKKNEKIPNVLKVFNNALQHIFNVINGGKITHHFLSSWNNHQQSHNTTQKQTTTKIWFIYFTFFLQKLTQKFKTIYVHS
jgi:hypothetical protein